MSLPFQPFSLNFHDRLLTLASADNSFTLVFDLALQADDEVLRLQGQANIEAPMDVGSERLAQLPLKYHTPPLDWNVTITRSADDCTILIGSTIYNPGPEPVRLGECRLVEVTPKRGKVTLVGDTGQAVYLSVSGTTGPTRVAKAAAPPPPTNGYESGHYSATLLQVVSHEAARALHLGFITFDSQNTVLRFEYEESGFQTLQAVCDFQGLILPPGSSVATETLMIEVSEDFHESLHHWADRVATHYQPQIWPTIPAGWLGWSWVDAFNVENYEEVMLRNCRAIRRRLGGFDIGYVWESIGNIRDGLPGAWLEWDYNNFPHGHEFLVEELRKLDFILGFWCGAFWLVNTLEDKVAQLSEAMLKLDGQPAVASAEWGYGASAKLPREQRPCIYSLDPTHPKTKEFIANVFATYREWGIRYYMVDFLNAIAYPNEGVPYNEHYDTSLARGPQVLREGLRTVRKAAQSDTYLQSSSGPTIQNTGYVDACRVGNDYGEGRAINPESYFYPATFVINGANFWTSHSYASGNMAGYYYTHRKLYLNDSGNVMTLDKPVPLCEAQIVATIFGMCGGPVMLGDDIDRISEERLALIKKVFPRTPEVAVPVDLFDRPLPDYPRLFLNQVRTEWSAWDVISILNYDDDPLTLPVSLARLGLDPDAKYRLWEFWNEQYLGTVSGEFRAVVPPRSARIYRLSKLTGYPWVLGTDMHVMQGQVELSEVVWDRATLTLSGQATRPAGNVGNVFISAPRGLAVANPRGYHIAKDAHDQTLIISRQFEFGDQPEPFNLTFIIADEKYAREELDLT